MTTPTGPDSIAIVGMAGRFPKAENVDEFWDNAVSGRDCFTETSVDDLIALGLSREVAENPDVVRRCPRVRHFRPFDRDAFGLSAEETDALDPQQQMLLECVWHALEDSGYDPHRFDGLIGMWAGLGFPDYAARNLNALFGPFQGVTDPNSVFTEPAEGLLARVARVFNLGGPVVTVQTACSTGLIAVHMACRSLQTYQCDLALAGAVSIQYLTLPVYLFAEGEIFSPDGHCRAFDKQANGTVLGEGCGVVALRRLQDAIASGDTIHAIIRGTAANNDGATRAGYTAPGVAGQAELIAAAQAVAGVSARQVSYIEAHGTGTNLGDPIELSALTQAFRSSTDEVGFCGIGSVKSLIGHLDAAAGIAGLIKAVCAVRHRTLPPTLHYTEPNPALNLESSPFFVVDRLKEWQDCGWGRIAGVSSFGLGGTNAHAIIEEYSQPARPVQRGSAWQLLMVSAAADAALAKQCSRLSAFMRKNEGSLELSDVAFTLRVGRQLLTERRCVVADSISAAATQLEQPDAMFAASGVAHVEGRPVVFLFSGQGSQYAGMGFGLFVANRVFRDNMERCSRALGPLENHVTLLDVLYGGKETDRDVVNQTAIAQPALFAVEFSLARVWESLGIKPVAVAGHSIGEYTAACEAGVLSLNDAITLVRKRGLLMQSMEPGAMLAVLRPEAEVRAMLPSTLDIAVINSPNITVASGPRPEIEQFAAELDKQGISKQFLHTSHAFHSRMMDTAFEPLTQAVRSVTLQPPRIPVASNHTGGWLSDTDAVDPMYWAKHMRGTVRFGQNLSTIASRFEAAVLLELGPGNTLCNIARQQPDPARALPAVSSLRHARESIADEAVFLRAVGALWCHGAEASVPLTAGLPGSQHKVALPNYPFEENRSS